MSEGTLLSRPPRPNQSLELVGFAVVGSSIRLQSRSRKSASSRPRTVTGDRFRYVIARDKNEGIGAARTHNSARCLSVKRQSLHRPTQPRQPLVMSTMSLPRFASEAPQGLSEDAARLQADACTIIPRSVKSGTPSQPTSDAQYLQDTYDYIFQKHTNTLNGVISRHLAAKADPEGSDARTVDITSCTGCENGDLDPDTLPCAQTSEKRCGTCDNCRTLMERCREKQDATSKPPSVQVTRKNGVPPKLATKLEELSLKDHSPRPVITFSHVDGEGRLERGDQFKSRSPSPLLEVPSPSEFCKEIMRPPIN